MIKQKLHNLFLEPLSEKDFNTYFDKIMERTKNVLKVKAREYARNNDRMHNFNKASIKKQITREQALDGMRLKHQISIDDINDDIELGLTPIESVVTEKFGDRLTYDILEEISILHRINYKIK
jgi:hypothetical protein